MGVRAHLMKGVRKSWSSDDKKYGLMCFERERVDSNGDIEMWVGVPVHNLPMVAVAAIRAIPQPEGANHPAVFDAEVVQFAVGPFGELLLTLEFQEGASLSLKLTEHQAASLQEGIPKALEGARRMGSPSTQPH